MALLVGCAVSIAATIFVTLLMLNLTLGRCRIQAPVIGMPVVDDPRFLETMSSVLPRPLVVGNAIVPLRNGDEIFPAMLAAIRDASTSLTLETYIYWSGDSGDAFSKAIADAARRGCVVKVLLDWVGGDLHEGQLRRMREAGVDIRRYNPPRWMRLGHMNNRTHRKLMVADGRVGFIGGVGLADHWSGDAQDPQHWRDTHFRVEGPVVTQLQSAFVDNWLQTAGELLHGPPFFAANVANVANVGNALAQVFTSSPEGGARSMRVFYSMSISAATETLELSASYFVPDSLTVDALCAAARRGVRVRVLVPGKHIDRRIVRHASRAGWGPLLAAGIEIHEYRPTMFHCKVLVVDRRWVSVGSTNFDARSFDINDEANLNVHDPVLGAGLAKIFDEDLRLADRVTLCDWSKRRWLARCVDRASATVASQL